MESLVHVVDIIIGVAWVALLIYWVVAAGTTKATDPSHRRTGFIGVRIVVIVIVVLALRVPGLRHHLAATDNPWQLGIGLAVFLLGMALAVWARATLGRNWGQPMTQRLEPELVTSGPYRYVRHPIYSGLLLGLIGSAIAVSPVWLIAVVLLGGYFIHSARVEERMMEALFPDAYPRYRHTTKMLIPFVL